MTREAISANPEPWWLGDEQTCGFCHYGYAVHIELRCVACDRPVCPLCVVRVQEQRWIFCPDCDVETEA